jgi:hypothetical protein
MGESPALKVRDNYGGHRICSDIVILSELYAQDICHRRTQSADDIGN